MTKLVDAIGNPQAADNESGHVIKILHIPTSKYVAFRAFLTQFTDSYASKWTGTSVYGRMDDIYNFQQTTRTINIAWDVPAESVEEAIDNLARAQKFVQFTYPTYESLVVESEKSKKAKNNKTSQDSEPNTPETNAFFKNSGQKEEKAVTELTNLIKNALSSEILNASSVKKTSIPTTIAAPPLLKIKFDNLIKSPNSILGDESVKSGIVGFVDNITFAPDLEAGWFGSDIDGIASNNLVPKLLKFSCKFTVLHDHPLGWDSQDGTAFFGDFPYNANSIKKVAKFVSAKKSTLNRVTNEANARNSGEFNWITYDEPAPKENEQQKAIRNANLAAQKFKS